MSMSTVQNATPASPHSSLKTAKNAAAAMSASSFAATLSGISNGTKYSDAEVQRFFAGKPSAQKIAEQASALGLNEAQIMRAMSVGGFGGNDANTLKSGIENFVSDPNSGFSWNSDGTLISSKASIAQVPASSNSEMPVVADIKAFYATNPSDKQIIAKAKSLGLNPAQMVQAEVAGEGMNMNQVNAAVLETMYVDAAQKLGVNIGAQGAWNSYFSPTLGRAITPSEIQSFFATSPGQAQIFQKASDWGLGVGAVNNMMVGLGISKTPDAAIAMEQKMEVSLFQGVDGYSLNQAGAIVPGGGKHFVWTADRSGGSWAPNSDVGANVNATA